MARTNNLTNFLTDVADAIREKAGTSAPIQASNFDTAIEEIPSGGGFDGSEVRSTTNMFARNTTMTEAPYFNTENVTNMSNMFDGCTNLIQIPIYNTSKVQNFNYFINSCSNLETFPALNTSAATNFTEMFRSARKLKTVPALNAEKVTSITTTVFYLCNALENFGGFVDLGKAYTAKTSNNYAYNAGVTNSYNLTHDSLMNIVNNLYDLNLSYDVAGGGTLYTQTFQLGSNLSKLTAAEIAIATDKGWTIT